MLSKHHESTEVDRRTWLHVPSETHWSTSSYIRLGVEIWKETMYVTAQMCRRTEEVVPKVISQF